LVRTSRRPGLITTESEADPASLRILASTGTHSQAPLFNIGLFLPSGLKLAEGHGSSLKMAEHRAAVNALLSIFLVRNENDAAQPGRPGEVVDGPGSERSDVVSALPTSAHSRWAITGGRVEVGKKYLGEVKVGSETIVESRQKAARG
jgi:large subunit ribosomal protein L44